MDELARRIDAVLGRIRRAERAYGREPGSVQLLAVSKTKPAALVRDAHACGLRRFGENYLQEALEKMSALADLDLEWHFIGPLQSNKTRAVAAGFDWVHSVDRAKLAHRLHEQRPPERAPLNVCLQVNIGGETSKSGVAPGELPALADALAGLDRLRLRGLMAIPAPESDFERQRSNFAQLRVLRDDLQRRGFVLDTLSMGMTDDLEAAVAEGATLVRVGTGIFGARTAPT